MLFNCILHVFFLFYFFVRGLRLFLTDLFLIWRFVVCEWRLLCEIIGIVVSLLLTTSCKQTHTT